MIRKLVCVMLLAGLAACSQTPPDLERPVVALGDFKLGHSEVAAPDPKALLISRQATPEEWIAEVDRAMEARFRRFDGGKFYHLGIKVEEYSLPPPVVPGKSALALAVTVWDDASQSRLNEQAEPIHVIKVFESRITKTREDQMRGLAEEAALVLEKWLRKQQVEQGWFGGPPSDSEAAPQEEQPQDAAEDSAEG
ncbi:MAG: hypothetical protein N4A53_06830 [Pelagimonas sp.]|nr:hypothetical protein [Pelagimonas sp.]